MKAAIVDSQRVFLEITDKAIDHVAIAILR
jgi:hypothetical protein